MKRHHVLLTGLCLAASALTLTLTLTAQENPAGPRHANGPRGPRQDGPPRPHLLATLDANGDRALSAEELNGAPAVILKMDANQDGVVTRDEWNPAPRGPRHQGTAAGTSENNPPRGAQAKPPVPPVVGLLDVNQDGALSADEIAAAPTALLKLDANQDGQITADEIRPAQARGPGGPGPNGRGGPRGPGAGRGFGRGPGGPPADAATE